MVKKNIKMLSPENYIRQKGRSLPIHECLINTDWKQAKTANILICRLQPSGKYTVGIYLVDLLCLGVKDTDYFFNLPEDEYQKMVNEYRQHIYAKNVSYTLVHNIIYASIGFADQYGLKPCKRFEITIYLLEEDTEKIKLMDIECGENGKPVLILSQEYNALDKKALAVLEKTAGKGNFSVIFRPENSESSDSQAEDNYNKQLNIRRFRFLDLAKKKKLNAGEESELMELCNELFPVHLDDKIINTKLTLLTNDIKNIISDNTYLDGVMGCSGMTADDFQIVDKAFFEILQNKNNLKKATIALNILKQQYYDRPFVQLAEYYIINETDRKRAATYLDELLTRYPHFSLLRILKMSRDYALQNPDRQNRDAFNSNMKLSNFFDHRVRLHPKELEEYFLMRIRAALNHKDLEDVEAIGSVIKTIGNFAPVNSRLEQSVASIKLIATERLILDNLVTD